MRWVGLQVDEVAGGGAGLMLRRAEVPLAGYPSFGLGVGSYTELLHWEEHLTTVDAEHSAVRPAHLGWAVTVTGPDLILIQLRTDDGPRAAKTSRRSYPAQPTWEPP